MRDWDFGSFEAKCIDAAIDPSEWIEALEQLTMTTDSYGALLIPACGGTTKTFPFTPAMGPSSEQYMKEGWHLRDERRRGVPLMTKYAVVDDLDIFTPEAIAKHPYYQEFLAPHGLRWFAGIGAFFQDDIWCVSLQRRLDQDPFSRQEKEQLARLSTTVSSAAAVARTLGSVACSGLLEAFAISGTAVVLVDRSGRIFESNPAAERMLSGEIKIVKGRLLGVAGPFKELEDSLSRLLHSERAGVAPPPLPLRRSNAGPILAYPAKLSASASNALAECQAVIVLVDPQAKKSTSRDVLQRVYKLSSAEARLCEHLGSGEPLEVIAERLAISKETSRTQLRSISTKWACIGRPSLWPSSPPF